MVSLERRNGYFMRDERNSGGIKLEIKSPTCTHCNRVILVFPDKTRAALGLPLRTHPRGYCPKCDAYVCDQYACQNFCTPIWKLIDIAKRNPGVAVFARPNGQLPFDPALLDQDKVYPSAGGILLPNSTKGRGL